jgi:hypothetical protein
MKRIPRAALLAALLTAAPAFASDQAVTYPFDGDFDDATFALESAILDRGLVIDYVSHTGEMLERTKGDVGSDVTLFTNADIFLFCSASLSRKVMEADPMNIAHCPYAIFARCCLSWPPHLPRWSHARDRDPIEKHRRRRLRIDTPQKRPQKRKPLSNKLHVSK